MSSSNATRALKGIRVLDFSRILAGPFCTMLLGDMGADVVKIERPGTGDDTRTWGPPFLHSRGAGSTSPSPGNSEDDESVSTYFLSVNRNKRSASIDMKTDRGQRLCRRLATEWADVVVENFRVGTMEKFGLGYDSLRLDNPGLVYCSITGFGHTGPLRHRHGYDVIVSGMYGLMSITGDERGGPAKVGVAMTDLLTGSLANSGILAALLERESTGLGRRIDSSLMETQLAALVNVASSSLNAPPGSSPPKRWGTAHASIVPYQAFRCKCGGYVVVGANNDQQFQDFCRDLGADHIAQDDRFRSNPRRVENRDILIPILEEIFRTKTRDEWVRLLDGRVGYAFGPIRTVPEAFACEQAVERNMVMTLDHPIAGTIRLPGHPLKFTETEEEESSSGDEPILPPPMLGQHTEEVLKACLGKSTSEIDAYIADDIISCWQPPA